MKKRIIHLVFYGNPYSIMDRKNNYVLCDKKIGYTKYNSMATDLAQDGYQIDSDCEWCEKCIIALANDDRF